jgi:hypothetical protein
VTIDSLSLRNALRWMGQTTPGGGFGRFALKARANVVGASVALTNVNVEIDGNVAEGVMTFANNGRQTLQATLAAGALDFTPYISTFRLLASGARDWNRQLFDLTSLSTTDLDMRLSAAKVTVGPTKLGRTAFGANLFTNSPRGTNFAITVLGTPFTVTTNVAPPGTFWGVTSDTPISSVDFTLQGTSPTGGTWAFIDNFTYGAADTEGPPPETPEAATMLLIGSGLVGFAILGRKMRPVQPV